VSVSSAAAPASVITASLCQPQGSIGSQVVISGSGFGARKTSAVLLHGARVTINT